MPALKPFALTPSLERVQLACDMIWAGSLLELRFHLAGDLTTIKGLSSHREPSAAPTEGLWEHTCFEAFFGPEGKSVYYEVNAAADGRWMVFRFESERAGRTVHAELAPNFFDSQLRQGRFEMTLRFDVSDVAELAGAVLIATPAAVLEEAAGAKSYWSLTHSSKPDFHDPSHRLLRLTP